MPLPRVEYLKPSDLVPDGWMPVLVPDESKPRAQWRYDLSDAMTLAYYLGICIGGSEYRTRAQAAKLLVRLIAQVGALKTMVRVNAYRHGATKEEVDSALANIEENPDA